MAAGSQEKFKCILQAFERCNLKESEHMDVHRLSKVLKLVNPTFTDGDVESIFQAAGLLHNGTVSFKEFVQWLFDERISESTALAAALSTPTAAPHGAPPARISPAQSSAASPSASSQPAALRAVSMPTGPSGAAGMSLPSSAVGCSRVSLPGRSSQLAELQDLVQRHPYLEATCDGRPHPLHYWLQRCRECLDVAQYEAFETHLELIKLGLESDRQRTAAAFKRFDANSSGALEGTEFQYMCAYLGWGIEEALLMDLNKDGKVSLPEFQDFVGRMGGMQRLFEHRRRRVNVSRRDIDSVTGADVGSRVRAHFYKDGLKSDSWKEASVLAVRVGGCPDAPGGGVLLEFGFWTTNRDEPQVCWKARQVVPPGWILSGVEDAAIATALREVGVLSAEHSFWHSIFPESEMRSMANLVDCQRSALRHVRNNATLRHDKAMPELRKEFERRGWGEYELQAVLSWIQELAPVLIHVHLDTVGGFLESDEFYRSQFETKTSFGALDEGNNIRKNWEAELFGDNYQTAKPFDRCKYGVLNVTNDFRGVVSALQYGDSYMVLKDVRLRCTFASEDSGGMKGHRLGMLDKYAHVLQEYSQVEMDEVVRVACAAMGSKPGVDPLLRQGSRRETPGHLSKLCWPQLLRGSTEDPTRQWITVGYPNLPQSRGCYYFEVELENCLAAQVGVVSKSFVCTPGVESASGVGDDEHGWAVDGQHAARWHAGRVLPWSMTWASHKKVVVGVAVDFTTRQITFSCDGKWDEEFVFSDGDIPDGIAVYPAASFQGRASFIFGPDYRHKPSNKFARWPGTEPGVFKVDCPRVGNSEVLNIYKEAQIHGEVNLKQNVQRLVVNSKYRTKPKAERSWVLCAIKAGRCEGRYERVGVHGRAPLYRNANGSVMFYHEAKQCWMMNFEEDFEDFLFHAKPSEGGCDEPPRLGWQVSLEHYGVVETMVFKAGLQRMGIGSVMCDKLASGLSGKDKSGTDVIYRKTSATTFDDEWESIADPIMTADSAWEQVVDEAQRSCVYKVGLPPQAVAMESEHPYPPTAHTTRQEVCIEGVPGMTVFFSKQCVTYDNCATLTIQTGGLRKASAGPGARVEVSTPDCSTVRGMLVEKRIDGLWKVRLDTASLADMYQAPEADCYSVCQEDPEVIRVSYPSETKVKEEITGFKLDRSNPLNPVGISGFVNRATKNSSSARVVGPAEAAGVKPGWFLDLKATLFGPSQELIANLQGEGLGAPVEDLESAFTHLDDVMSRLRCLLDCSDVMLVFVNCCAARLLPEAHVHYTPEQRVGDELRELKASDSGALTVSSFSKPGPAYHAGVRPGWQLSLSRTLSPSSLELTEEAVKADPRLILNMRSITLVFELQEVAPKTVAERNGNDWSSCEIAGDYAEFVFNTDGDGGSFPERRWGFFAVVVPQGTDMEVMEMGPEACNKWEYKPPDSRHLDIRAHADVNANRTGGSLQAGAIFEASEERMGSDGITYLKLEDGRGWVFDKTLTGQSLCVRLSGSAAKVEELMELWEDVTQSVRGMKEMPSVERDGWDERRLRALCERHGWEFEWMTEDGERDRRGRERHVRVPLAKKLSAKCRAPDKGRPDGYVVT